MPSTPAPPPPPLCIAIVGAESTGKTTLAHALAQALASAAGTAGAHPRVARVPEWLRTWCERHGRTPRADEQAGIAAEHHARIAAAAAAHDIVVCDTTALMTAVYSRLVFGDRSLEARAVEWHRGQVHLTLLTALDLPWVADGHQRDGPHVREPVDDALRELLHRHRLPYAVAAGRGDVRLAQALAAVEHAWPSIAAGSHEPRTPKLFTGLSNPAPAAMRRWVCECCVPEAELALRAAPRR